MDFKIPSRYTVGGQDVKVEIVESDGNDYGNYNQAKGVLRICEKVGETPQSDTVQLNTFFHELTHSILGIMGEIELNNNEKFVSCFSSFLTEAIRTME